MEPLQIKRAGKERKSKTLTFRLTPDELDHINQLIQEMEFDNSREFILFCIDVVGALKGWKDEGNRFFIGDSNNNYNEVEFEFTPDF